MTEPDGLTVLQTLGAHQLDPVRFARLQALSRRLAAQSPAVAVILSGKLDTAVARWLDELSGPSDAGTGLDAPAVFQARPQAHGGAGRLADLNRRLHAIRDAQNIDSDSLCACDRDPNTLPSVRRFGESWSRLATDQRIADALARGPENAGPLNSHRLMLRALGLMRELSPDYLRRFVGQAEALLWLGHATQPAAPNRARGTTSRQVPRKGRTRPGGTG